MKKSSLHWKGVTAVNHSSKVFVHFRAQNEIDDHCRPSSLLIDSVNFHSALTRHSHPIACILERDFAPATGRPICSRCKEGSKRVWIDRLI